MVVGCSVSYLTDIALKWKIMNQIQEAQDLCSGIALVQVLGAVTHVSSSINKERSENPIRHICAEEVLGLFHCLQLAHDEHTTDQIPAKAASEMRIAGLFLFAHLNWPAQTL